jgi:hypothetical protein
VSKSSGAPKLSINFDLVVGDAEHLAVLGRAIAALTPCRDVVGIRRRAAEAIEADAEDLKQIEDLDRELKRKKKKP